MNKLIELDSLANSIERRGVNFAKFIRDTDKAGQSLPHYSIRVDGETQFLHSDEELAEAIKEYEKKKGIKAEDSAAGQPFAKAQLDLVEFYEANEIESILKDLKKEGFDVDSIVTRGEDTLEDSYVPRDARKKSSAKEAAKKKKSQATAAPYKIVSEKEETFHESLLDALEAVREEARKGLQIQRYKGLGEMNPEQLWETTMNPATRTLVQVKLEDAAKADEVFSILMGDEVAPRKNFIQEYAREVRNLDI